MTSFKIFVEDDVVQVRFVSRKELGHTTTGHGVAGEHKGGVIKVARWETHGSQRAIVMHELGHYLVEHDELAGRGKYLVEGATEEDVCELFAWIPIILRDPRNAPLRRLIGVE